MPSDGQQRPQYNSLTTLCGVVGALLALFCMLLILMRVRASGLQATKLESMIRTRGGSVVVHSAAPKWLPESIRSLEFFSRAVEVHCESFPTTEAAIEALALNYTAEVPVLPVKVDESTISEIGNANSLHVLFLDYLPITDADLVQLSSLKHLEALGISGTHCTAVGVERLRRFENLKYLRCSDMPINDDVVANLIKLKNLELLDISYTSITPNGIERLATMPKLRELRVIGLQISDEMRVKLTSTFPKIAFIFVSEFNFLPPADRVPIKPEIMVF